MNGRRVSISRLCAGSPGGLPDTPLVLQPPRSTDNRHRPKTMSDARTRVSPLDLDCSARCQPPSPRFIFLILFFGQHLPLTITFVLPLTKLQALNVIVARTLDRTK